MSDRVAKLVEHFTSVAEERMRGLPIVNPMLEVEAVGFQEVDGHALGILISPWFMNLVLLPGSREWGDFAQGAEIEWRLPAGPFPMNVCHDEKLGTYLTGVLFRTVGDFPDQDTAREIAAEILARLHREPEPPAANKAGRTLSRRELFARLGAD